MAREDSYDRRMQIDAYFASLGRGMSYFLFCLVIAADDEYDREELLRLLKPIMVPLYNIYILNAAYGNKRPREV